jgi:hypothetical protein
MVSKHYATVAHEALHGVHAAGIQAARLTLGGRKTPPVPLPFAPQIIQYYLR